MHRTFVPILIVGLALASPFLVVADTASDLRISTDGTVTANNVIVVQRGGGNIFVRATWGSAYVRMTLVTTAATVITKEHGESASVNDINVGDRLDVSGSLTSGADSILFTPKTIRDHALESAPKSLSGTIVSTNASASSFVLKTSLGTVTVTVPPTVSISKGLRTIAFSELAAGDKVTSVAGTYSYADSSLAATSLTILQDQGIFKPHNFSGILVSLDATTLPTSATVAIDGTNYTVTLDAKTVVQRASRTHVSLVRFQNGDTVRLYGAIRPTDLTVIDAEVIRDLSF